jgi:hypothetical protein
MDTPNMPTMLETLSALRGAYADLPAAKIAAILHQLDPETAARVQAIITEFDQREAPLKAEIAQQEAAINSDVEGYFTAKVSTNVYDTAAGRHLLVPQGNTILGHDQSSVLLYGNERLPTISLTLALPDGRSVDLGQAPVTDQQDVAGLTGRFNNHYWRLFGAVFIGGALRGACRPCRSGWPVRPGPGRSRRGSVASGIRP